MKKIAKLILALFLVMTTVGFGLAATRNSNSQHPFVVIHPTSGPNVESNGTILVPVGQDANTSVGLYVEYGDFKTGDAFDINITNNTGESVYHKSGSLTTGNDNVPVHWMVANDLSQEYLINAQGVDREGKRVTTIAASAPVIPIPVYGSVLIGFVVASGLYYRRFKGKKK